MSAIETTGFDPSPAGSTGGAADFKERLRKLAGGYSNQQKMIAAGVVVAVVAGLFVVSRMSGGAPMAPLYTNVSAEDGGTIIAELEKLGIPHQISAGGSSILVPADQVHETRMKMSSSELPSSTKVGYGVLDSQGLTTSEFGQRVGFQRAMEGELARTIESLDAVDTAVVHLALPAEQVFARDTDKPSASVLVRTAGAERLSEDQVRAVVNLVASGIEGMTPEAVTVADSDGNVLSAPGQGVNDATGGGTRQRQTRDFEQGVKSSLEDLLAGIVGDDGASVTVNAVLDFDEQSVSRETFATPEAGADGQPLRLEESTRTETYLGDDPTTGGVLGPDTPATAGRTGTDYDLQEADVRYAVNRVVESTNQAPGKIERLSVAVAVDETRVNAAQLQRLTPLLEAGAGIDAARGDVLSVSRAAFDGNAARRAQAQEQIEAAEAARAAESRGRTIRTVVGAVLLLLLAAGAFAMHRQAVRRRELRELEDMFADQPLDALPPAPAVVEALDEADVLDLSPAALESIGVDADSEALVPIPDPVELEVAAEEQIRHNRQAAVAELIEQQPDEVAALLRSWLGDRRAVSR